MSQHKATRRRTLQSALANRRAANEILDSLFELQSKLNGTLDKLDANGTPSPGAAEITEITSVADVDESLSGAYFLISSPNDDYYVWMDTGSSVDPAVAGRTGIQVALEPDDSANIVAGAIAGALDAVADFDASADADVVTVECTDVGAVEDAEDGAAPTGFSFDVTQQGADASDGLDTDYVATGSLSGMIDPDTQMFGAQYRASLRRTLQSALAHRRLANEMLGSLSEIEARYQDLLAKLDAEGGTLDDTNYASTLSVSILDPDMEPSTGAQHKASLRKSLRSALAHRKLADEILDALAGAQAAFNAALMLLDAADISGNTSDLKVEELDPEGF